MLSYSYISIYFTCDYKDCEVYSQVIFKLKIFYYHYPKGCHLWIFLSWWFSSFFDAFQTTLSLSLFTMDTQLRGGHRDIKNRLAKPRRALTRTDLPLVHSWENTKNMRMQEVHAWAKQSTVGKGYMKNNSVHDQWIQ